MMYGAALSKNASALKGWCASGVTSEAEMGEEKLGESFRTTGCGDMRKNRCPACVRLARHRLSI
jgi:hypothetical protein